MVRNEQESGTLQGLIIKWLNNLNDRKERNYPTKKKKIQSIGQSCAAYMFVVAFDATKINAQEEDEESLCDNCDFDHNF